MRRNGNVEGRSKFLRDDRQNGKGKGQGGSRFREGKIERKAKDKAVLVGTRGGWFGGVNWRDEIENVCGGEFVGGDGFGGGWAGGGDSDGWGEAADDVCGFDGDEAGE